MTRYYLEITCQMHNGSRSEMEKLFEPLADAVYDLTEVVDPDLGADMERGLFDFTMVVDADDEVAALRAGLAAVRCALHAVGKNTPGWEQHIETIRQVVARESALTTA